jgi:hypothetical protein
MHDTYTRLGLHVGLLVIYGPITSGSTSPETLSFMTNQHWFPYVLWNFFSCNLYAYIFIHFNITWPYFTKMQTLQSRDYIFDVTREFQIFVFAFGIFCSANHCHHLLETILSFIHLNFTSLFYCNEIFRFKALLISLMHFFLTLIFILVKIDVNRCPSRSGCEYYYGSDPELETICILFSI